MCKKHPFWYWRASLGFAKTTARIPQSLADLNHQIKLNLGFHTKRVARTASSHRLAPSRSSLLTASPGEAQFKTSAFSLLNISGCFIEIFCRDEIHCWTDWTEFFLQDIVDWWTLVIYRIMTIFHTCQWHDMTWHVSSWSTVKWTPVGPLSALW